MESYDSFALIYDELMDNVPYDEWSEFIAEKLKEQGINDGLVCELGCGTGEVTMRLCQFGYDMIGIDNSEQMLLVAREKQYDNSDIPGVSNILYLMQDMREFELYGTVKAVVSVCDCVNYILSEEDLTHVFSLVNNYLDPQGVFYFDFNTTYKYGQIMGDMVVAENREDCSFIWENYYDGETQTNEYDLTIFMKAEDDLYEKHTETHIQKGYTLDQMKKTLQDAGLKFMWAMDVDTKKEPGPKSERICIMAMEQGK